ncbi:unnamed protein product [Heligmosomoides polygyrus]|uniref:DNA topoisomerase n=1 Tax=Heligmosomoides polygyrus TaxID=6339 RepID=A0A183FE51_HELPZ|nr:unnamed protein product [Heligmosomoides polygyrus]
MRKSRLRNRQGAMAPFAKTSLYTANERYSVGDIPFRNALDALGRRCDSRRRQTNGDEKHQEAHNQLTISRDAFLDRKAAQHFPESHGNHWCLASR